MPASRGSSRPALMYSLLVEIHLTVDVVQEPEGWIARGKLRIGERTAGVTAAAPSPGEAVKNLAAAVAEVLEDPPSSPAMGNR